jgi:Tubulin-tyrosine ligase family
VLYDGRKCHVRVYGLMTSDGRAFVHRRAFLHVANEPFLYKSKESEFLASVHITNCCANSHDKLKFAGEICADMEATDFSEHGGHTVVPLADFFSSISASIAELSRRSFPFLRGGEANNGFEYLGMDFILSYDANNVPVVYMLEVNAPPSQDTATGLSHAESLHNDVIRDILTLWVFPKVTSQAAENPGGWKCVYDGRGDNVSDTTLIVPSKAAILSKIRWAIFEQERP